MDIFTLKNKNMKIEYTDFGATVLHVYAPDKDGNVADVVYGYDTEEEYVKGDDYVGATVGRFANRIANSEFTLGGTTYKLNANNGKNQCHGGLVGFDKKKWTIRDADYDYVCMTLLSPDGEENYPGTVGVTLTMSLSEDNEFAIRYVAEADRATPINLTNHSYFNLGGRYSGDIKDTVLWIDADHYLPTDEELIPTGEIRAVDGTPFDFRTPKKKGRDMDFGNVDIKYGRGYDHCFAFKGWEKCVSHSEIKPRAMAADLKTGRTLEMFTNSPCVQLYTANTLTNHHYEAFCLETQFMPDSVHHENFTDCILRPHTRYEFTTVYKFGVMKD